MTNEVRNEVRIEIVGRNDFWRNAFRIEWDYQFPDRRLSEDSPGFFRVPKEWLEDLERVAAQCFSRVLLAPSDPGRRQLLNIFRRRDGDND